MDVAKRLHTVEEYYFSRKLREVNLLKANGKPIINLGIGSPDLQPPQKVIDAITKSLNDVNAHQYQSYQGLPELREAISDFYRDQFLVHVSPMTEVLPLIGSKEGIMHISMAFLNEGDEVLIPNPGYLTYASVTKLIGAIPVFYNLDENKDWLPDLKALKTRDLSKVKIMWINYPHMPTGAKATEQLFEELVDFARAHDILIVNDNPYSFILNENPLSILEIEDAKEVAIELNSLSKTFNMAGWRVGMVLGDAEIIKTILQVKSNMDSGMFFGIQKGAVEAFKLSNDWFQSQNEIYKERRAIVWKIFDALNCTYVTSIGGLFVWAKLPKGMKSEDITDELLYNKNVFITPGTIFGSNGEGYVRASLCVDVELLNEVLNRLTPVRI